MFDVLLIVLIIRASDTHQSNWALYLRLSVMMSAACVYDTVMAYLCVVLPLNSSAAGMQDCWQRFTRGHNIRSTSLKLQRFCLYCRVFCPDRAAVVGSGGALPPASLGVAGPHLSYGHPWASRQLPWGRHGSCHEGITAAAMRASWQLPWGGHGSCHEGVMAAIV